MAKAFCLSSFAFAITTPMLLFGASSQQEKSNSHAFPGCGEMACFSLLRLTGNDVNLSDVTSRFHERIPGFTPTEVSVFDLRTVLSSYEVHTTAVRLDSQRCSELPVPCIVYFRPGRWIRNRNRNVGHFLTVSQIQRDKLLVFDWEPVVTEPEFWLPIEVMQQTWDGDVIMISSPQSTYLPMLLLCCGLAFSFYVVRRKGMFYRRQLPMVLTIALVPAVLSGCGSGSSMSTDDSNPATPSLRFDQATKNLGTIRNDARVEIKFPFTVSDQGAVRITHLSKACSCIAVNSEIVGQPLEAGSRHELVLGFSPSGTAAKPEIRSVQITTEPPSKLPINIVVTYRPLMPPQISVKQLLIDGELHRRGSSRIEITHHRGIGDRQVKVVPARCHWGNFTFLDSTITTQEFFGNDDEKLLTDTTLLEIQSPECGNFGEHRSLIRLVYDDGSVAELPTLVRIQHPFALSVKKGFCGRHAANDNWSISLPYRWTMAEVEIERIDCSLETTTVELTDSAILVKGKCPDIPGRFDGELKVHFRTNSLPHVTIPISGIVAGI